MNYRILKSEGGEMEKDITKIVKTLFIISVCGLFIFVGVMLWVLFVPSPRLERVKIAMHDEQTYQQLRLKHGQKATGIVIYEADGKAWYYKDGKKIAFK